MVNLGTVAESHVKQKWKNCRGPRIRSRIAKRFATLCPTIYYYKISLRVFDIFFIFLFYGKVSCDGMWSLNYLRLVSLVEKFEIRVIKKIA